MRIPSAADPGADAVALRPGTVSRMGEIDNTRVSGLLVPADPLRGARVDPHFAREAVAARELGADVVRIDHDALLRGDLGAALRAVPESGARLVYRGWMIPADRYADLETGLRERGVELLTPAVEYRRGHEFPCWYPHFTDHTPASAWIPGNGAPESTTLAAAAANLPRGAAIVKDWVKSRKHEWDSACFVPDLADTDRLERVVRTFAERQGEFLTGGIVLRAFEEFTGAEARVWWVRGEPVLVTAHPDTPDVVPDAPVHEFASAVRTFGAPFVTTDLARRTDGSWRVVEVGDGQVSDLPANTDPIALLTGILAAPVDRPELSQRPPGAHC
ncbi:ATP-grasp domain-containing protein [Nocardia sp. NPDC005978]|uniref:ATP-grasp domain-containing protein n=1 Tax=Nocardia sp. NPDC005978 TaxID=3156725 RepID=UPI00339F85BB